MVDSMEPQGWPRRRFVAASLAMAGAVPFARVLVDTPTRLYQFA